ncbi:MAG: hypothetical protein OXM55_00285 [Bdellovibrionales bacterium]|nr:hypothetical protein [Bdellovibrionales bacterium]
MNEAEAIAKKEEKPPISKPLVVDLDGTLIKTDLPWESFLSVLVWHPIELIKIIIRKIKIKKAGYFKLELEKRACFSLEALPLSKDFINYLKEEKERGRELVLCTGSTQTYADKIKKRTGFFDSAWGSTLGKNLVGKKKALFLVEKYGEKNFDYAGNSLADLKIAPYTHHFILVNPSVFTLFLSKKVKVHRWFLKKELNPTLFAYTLGFPLWFLNCLIFILPVFLSAFVSISYSFHNLFFTLAFSTVHFNFLATAFHVFFSMVYADRDRKKRAKLNLFATGDLSLPLGFFLSSLCLLLALLSLVYLILYNDLLSFIPTLLYIFCTYLLVKGKIRRWEIPIFVRYAFMATVVLLQGLIIVL